MHGTRCITIVDFSVHISIYRYPQISFGFSGDECNCKLRPIPALVSFPCNAAVVVLEMTMMMMMTL